MSVSWRWPLSQLYSFAGDALEYQLLDYDFVEKFFGIENRQRVKASMS
jgi:hypothetical protein